MAPAGDANPWKRFALVLGGVIVVIALLFVGYNLGGAGKTPGSSPVAQASATAPAIDMQKVEELIVSLMRSRLGRGRRAQQEQQATLLREIADDLSSLTGGG